MQLLETRSAVSPSTFTTQSATALLSADRICRIGDGYLGRLRLDSAMAAELAMENIGIFAERFLGLDTMLGRMLPLVNRARPSKSVLVYATRESGAEIYRRLSEDGMVLERRKIPEAWECGNLLFSSVESLKRLDLQECPVDLVALLDPTCMIYKARSMQLYNGRLHDRPELVAEFVRGCNSSGNAPPLMLMTTRRGAAVPTDAIARAFLLEAFWFIDGPSVRC